MWERDRGASGQCDGCAVASGVFQVRAISEGERNCCLTWCYRCSICSELLEHVSAYEYEGRPFCHLDYHEVCPLSYISPTAY